MSDTSQTSTQKGDQGKGTDKMAPCVAEAGRNQKAGSQTKPAFNISVTDGRWKVLYGTVEL